MYNEICEHFLPRRTNLNFQHYIQMLVWVDFSIGYVDTHLLMEIIQRTQLLSTVLEDSFLMQMKENTLQELPTCISFTKWVINRVTLFFKKSFDFLIQLSKVEHLHKTKGKIYKIHISLHK